jgi:hypothetical protein
MKVWPIDPLVLRNLKLEVPEKLPQGSSIKGNSPLLGTVRSQALFAATSSPI